MLKFLLKHLRTWRHFLLNKQYSVSLITGFLWLIIALVTNYYISSYNETFVTFGVGDLILDNIPTLDLNYFYTIGIYVVIFSLLAYAFFVPELVPFALKTFAIFVLVRSCFISLTHIGPPPGFYQLAGPDADSTFFQKFFFLNDLFFSAHTGIPFLAFLLLKGHIFRYFFLFASIILGATVLFMHVHYSIDVFGAYFITYGIYHLSDNIFHNLNEAFHRLMLIVENRERRFFKNRKKNNF